MATDEPNEFWSHLKPLKVTTCDSQGNLGTAEIPVSKWPAGPCYIAGKMRGLPDFGFDAFFDAEEQLKRAHAVVGLNPARYDIDRGCNPWGKTGHESIEELGYNYLPAMDHGLAYIREHAEWVCVLPGWETSRGSAAEIREAVAKGIPVVAYPSGRVLGRRDLCNVLEDDEPDQTAATSPPVEASCTGILEPGQLCEQASAIVAGARRKSYGPPEHNFERIAILHEAWDAVVATVPTGTISGTVNVAVRNVLQKLARIAETPNHTDSWRDVAGYADCGARCAGCDPTK